MQPSQLGARKSLGFEDLAKAAIKSGGERKDLLQHLGLPLQRIAHLYLFQDRWLKALPNTHPDYVLMTRSFNEFKLHSLPVMQAINEVHNRLRILELRHALPDLPKKIGAPGCRLLHLGLLYQFGTVHASVTTPTIRDKDSKDIPPPTVFAVTSESGTTTKIGVLGSAPDLFNEELEPDSDDDTNSVKQSAIKEVQTWRPDVKQLRLCILFDDCFVWARERKNGWQYINCIPLKSAFMTVLPRTIDRPHAFTLSGSKRSLDLVCSGHGYSGAGDGKNSIITDGETERREWMMRIGDAIKYSNSA
jgi:putative SOS response-associated peptidase YedK